MFGNLEFGVPLILAERRKAQQILTEDIGSQYFMPV
jgi:hypothetical protein